MNSPSRLLRLGFLLALCTEPRAFAQKPVVVTVDAVNPSESAIAVRFRDAARSMAMSPAMRVAVDDREATVAEILPGDKATVLYDKASRSIVSVEVWREMTPDIRVQLLEDGGFERASDSANLLRWERQIGHVASLAGGRHGERSLGLRVSAGNTEARVFSSPRRKIKPGAAYRLSVWAKGRGELRLNVYEYGATNPIGTQFFSDMASLSLTDEWQELRYDYKPEDKRLQSAAVALLLSGEGADATIDDASFLFTESDNPGVSLDDPPPTRELRIAVQARQADVEVAVSGRPAKLVNGVAIARASEGLVSMAIRATATGYRPGVRFRILEHPEADGRWRTSDTDAEGWHTVDFDDRAWPMLAVDKTGFAWSSSAKNKVACFRQVLLWNQAHYGPDRCILPKVREWGFSQDGFDNLLLALYSPLPFDLDDYEFVLDVPDAFELIGMDEAYYQRHVLNERPSRVIRESIRREGVSFTRYRLAFAAGQVPAEGTHFTWLPLRLRGGEPGTGTRFFFHRRGHGNFTECEQTIPVAILPPVNGSQPHKILISEYYPITSSALSPRHMRAMIAQSASAGFNFATVGITEPGWGAKWNSYQKSFYDELVTRGFGTSISSPGQFPLYGSHVPGHQSDAFLRWVAATPRAQATYYDGRRWTIDADSMYCPSYMIDAGAPRFRDLVARTYAEVLARTPAASVLFLDYEAHAWRPAISGGTEASTCFCDLCKARFRERAGIGKDVELSNQHIYDDRYQQWADFHDWQVTEIQQQMKVVANNLGLRSLIYSWSGFMPFWSNIGGKTDIAFIGSPGNNVASGRLQKGIDEEAQFLRITQAVPQVIGQRFSYLGVIEDKDSWMQLNALSDDGFVQAKSWKSQILRIVAAFGGGVDLQNAGECVAGMLYWIGEATRIIATYEDLFLDGERADHLATSEQIAYPDLLVLRKGRRRLVLLFNEGDAAMSVTLMNRELEPGQRARLFGKGDEWIAAESLEVVVPAGDAAAVEVD
jgi:hypothetical protein